MVNFQKSSSRFNRGFTLVELLIVIAVLGVLATVLLIAINPLEQLARGRDSGRISAVRQISTAMEAYAVNKSNYLTASTIGSGNWMDFLASSGTGDLKTVPVSPSYRNSAGACSNQSSPIGFTTNSIYYEFAQNGYCYRDANNDGTSIGIYASLEASTYWSRCKSIGDKIPFVIWYQNSGSVLPSGFGLTCYDPNDDWVSMVADANAIMPF